MTKRAAHDCAWSFADGDRSRLTCDCGCVIPLDVIPRHRADVLASLAALGLLRGDALAEAEAGSAVSN